MRIDAGLDLSTRRPPHFNPQLLFSSTLLSPAQSVGVATAGRHG